MILSCFEIVLKPRDYWNVSGGVGLDPKKLAQFLDPKETIILNQKLACSTKYLDVLVKEEKNSEYKMIKNYPRTTKKFVSFSIGNLRIGID